MRKYKNLFYRILLTIVFVNIGVATNIYAGIPVIDGGNLAQNLISAIESVAQTAKQIEQYKTQVYQYENMLQNTAVPVSYVWDQATVTMNKLRASVDTLSYYKNQLGSIDAYLGKFKDTTAYRNSPCYSVKGCTAAEWQAMKENQRFGSEAQKRANDALFRSLDQQQNALEADARQLEQLQANAQGATGQMQALGAANQLASHQANQLLQIRGLMIAQQNAIGTKMQVDADMEAKQQAAHEASTTDVITKTSDPKNWLELKPH